MNISSSCTVVPLCSFFPAASWIVVGASSSESETANNCYKQSLRSLASSSVAADDTRAHHDQLKNLQNVFVSALSTNQNDLKIAYNALDFLVASKVANEENHSTNSSNLRDILFCSGLLKKMRHYHHAASNVVEETTALRHLHQFSYLIREENEMSRKVDDLIAQEIAQSSDDDSLSHGCFLKVFEMERDICLGCGMELTKKSVMEEDSSSITQRFWISTLHIIRDFVDGSSSLQLFSDQIMKQLLLIPTTDASPSSSIASLKLRASLIAFDVDMVEYLLKSFTPTSVVVSLAVSKSSPNKNNKQADSASSNKKSSIILKKEDSSTSSLSSTGAREIFENLFNFQKKKEEEITFVTKSLQKRLSLRVMRSQLASTIIMSSSSSSGTTHVNEDMMIDRLFLLLNDDEEIVKIETMESIVALSITKMSFRLFSNYTSVSSVAPCEDACEKQDDASSLDILKLYLMNGHHSISSAKVDAVLDAVHKTLEDCFSQRSKCLSTKSFKPVLSLILQRLLKSLKRILLNLDDVMNTDETAEELPTNSDKRRNTSLTSILDVVLTSKEFEERIRIRENFSYLIRVSDDDDRIERSAFMFRECVVNDEQENEVFLMTTMTELKEKLNERRSKEDELFLNAIGEFY